MTTQGFAGISRLMLSAGYKYYQENLLKNNCSDGLDLYSNITKQIAVSRGYHPTSIKIFMSNPMAMDDHHVQTISWLAIKILDNFF